MDEITQWELESLRASEKRARVVNTALISALMGMVNQFFHEHDDEAPSHSFMSAEEEAIDLLVELGFADLHKSGKGYALLWDKLKEHKSDETNQQQSYLRKTKSRIRKYAGKRCLYYTTPH